jgi:hypothetical protein
MVDNFEWEGEWCSWDTMRTQLVCGSECPMESKTAIVKGMSSILRSSGS